MQKSTERSLLVAAWLSFFTAGAVLSLKYFAYLQTGSSAVFSDAVESIVNVVAATFALSIIRAVNEPADEEHPYGHGKLEYFSAAFEGGLISFAAIVVAYAAVRALIEGAQVEQIDKGLLWVTIASIPNFLLGFYLLRVGRREKSETLIASGSHVLSDVWTTAGVLLGLLLVKLTGIMWIDQAVAILVAGNLVVAGYKIVRRSIGGLIDEKESDSLRAIAEEFKKARKPGLIDLHKVKVIRSGRFHHIDGHIVVPEFWDVAHSHHETNAFEEEIIKNYHYDGEFAFHVDPCQQAFCSRCDLLSCPIRKRPYTVEWNFTEASIIAGPQKDPL